MLGLEHRCSVKIDLRDILQPILVKFYKVWNLDGWNLFNECGSEDLLSVSSLDLVQIVSHEIFIVLVRFREVVDAWSHL